MMNKQDKPRESFYSRLFQWTIIAIGGSLWAVYLFHLGVAYNSSSLLESAFFLVGVIAVSLNPVPITTPGMSLKHQRKLSISLSDSLTFLLLVLHGPAVAIVIGGLDGLIASRRGVKRWQSNFFTLAMYTISLQVATISYAKMMRLAGHEPYAGLSHSVQTLIAPLFVAAAVHFLVNSSLLSIILGLRYKISIKQHWLDNQLWTAVTYFPLITATIFLYICVQQVGWLAVIAAAPVLAIIYFSYIQYNKNVQEKMQKIEEMNELHLSIVQALALSIDAKDNTTADHVQRVKIYGRGMARLFTLSELEIQAIEAGAMLHDIGKLAVPDYIINKPGKLTTAEFEKMKIHTVVGAEILSQVKFPYPVVPVVLYHHERWDGTGYPHGIKGEEIPITARILSVVDCFDAVRETRQYRSAMTREQAIQMLHEDSGTCFDPQIVKVFLENLPEFESEITARNLNHKDYLEADTWVAQFDSSPASEQPGLQNQGYTRTLAKISEAHRELVMLYEIAQTVGSSLSLRDTLTILLERVQSIVPSTTSVVLLKDKGDERLKVASARGAHAEAFYSHTINSGAGIAGWVYANNKPMYNSDPRLDFDAFKVETSFPYSTSVVVPLAKDGRIIGVLALYSTTLDQYSQEHIRLVESIARLASDAVLNSLNHEEMEVNAFTDKLTELPNLRAIFDTFEKEALRAFRHNETFTLLMMDLDDFKLINDNHGHQVGDRFLKEISKLIASHMRGCDFFGRYGGDEFIALLPKTCKHDAEALADRIKYTVDNFVLIGENKTTSKAGISIGVAEFNQDGTTLEKLMAVADRSMYSEKAVRKNTGTHTIPLEAREKVLGFPTDRISKVG
jgi:diguanylate cyclase (GGDEF)-like protein/putative nucleotidyltransferase with HDIG domain